MTDGLIKVNNKNYYLKFNINAICNLALDGIDVLALGNNFNFITLRALFFHALQDIHRKQVQTLEDAGSLMSDYLEEGGTLEELANTITNTLMRALGNGSDNLEGK